MKVIEIGGGEYPLKPDIPQLGRYHATITHDLDTFPYPFKDSELNMIYMSHVLEHLQDPLEVLSELWRILSPTGILHCWVPHYQHPATWNCLDHKHYFGEGWVNCLVPSTTEHQHIRHKWKVLHNRVNYYKEATYQKGRVLKWDWLRKLVLRLRAPAPVEIYSILQPIKEGL